MKRHNPSPLRFRLAIAKLLSDELTCVKSQKSKLYQIHFMTSLAWRHNRPFWRTISRWNSVDGMTKAERSAYLYSLECGKQIDKPRM